MPEIGDEPATEIRPATLTTYMHIAPEHVRADDQSGERTLADGSRLGFFDQVRLDLCHGDVTVTVLGSLENLLLVVAKAAEELAAIKTAREAVSD